MEFIDGEKHGLDLNIPPPGARAPPRRVSGDAVQNKGLGRPDLFCYSHPNSRKKHNFLGVIYIFVIFWVRSGGGEESFSFGLF